jgi:hypothetical protein
MDGIALRHQHRSTVQDFGFCSAWPGSKYFLVDEEQIGFDPSGNGLKNPLEMRDSWRDSSD